MCIRWNPIRWEHKFRHVDRPLLESLIYQVVPPMLHLTNPMRCSKDWNLMCVVRRTGTSLDCTYTLRAFLDASPESSNAFLLISTVHATSLYLISNVPLPRTNLPNSQGFFEHSGAPLRCCLSVFLHVQSWAPGFQCSSLIFIEGIGS